ncbi:MAG: type II toxin-antitoxin system VapC family toxin [Burkholderiaceae bacterium]
MLILDTNTVSDYLRGEPQVVSRLQALEPGGAGIPAIVEYELRYGFARLPLQARQRQDSLLAVLRALGGLPFDSVCAEHAATIRAELEVAGTPIGPHDVLIAATARRYGGVLVTRNVREFARVPGLRLQNWHEA